MSKVITRPYIDNVQNIKDCGQSLIDNAETIVEKYKYLTGVDIICHCFNEEVPCIEIKATIIPEDTIIRCREQNK